MQCGPIGAVPIPPTTLIVYISFAERGWRDDDYDDDDDGEYTARIRRVDV
jgi:hypothetical protein